MEQTVNCNTTADDTEALVREQLKIIKKGALEIIQEDELAAKLRRSLTTKKPLTIKVPAYSYEIMKY